MSNPSESRDAADTGGTRNVIEALSFCYGELIDMGDDWQNLQCAIVKDLIDALEAGDLLLIDRADENDLTDEADMSREALADGVARMSLILNSPEQMVNHLLDFKGFGDAEVIGIEPKSGKVAAMERFHVRNVETGLHLWRFPATTEPTP